MLEIRTLRLEAVYIAILNELWKLTNRLSVREAARMRLAMRVSALDAEDAEEEKESSENQIGLL
jgi:hypothetical protein